MGRERPEDRGGQRGASSGAGQGTPRRPGAPGGGSQTGSAGATEPVVPSPGDAAPTPGSWASGGPDRRRQRRIPWPHEDSEPITLEVETPQGGWRAVPCTLVDLAAGGMGVLLAEPLEPGARVRVTIPLPSRVGREQHAGEAESGGVSPWTALAEVVHAGRPMERSDDGGAPRGAADAPRLYHRGVRFEQLKGGAELRLLRALYGPMPAGWGVERYTVGASSRVTRNGTAAAAGGAAAERHGRSPARPAAARYAVVRGGKRVARGFGSYDRARARAWSLHLDEIALQLRRHKPSARAE